MKFSKLFAAGALLLAIAGCKTVDIKDGKIPDAYISQAKKIEGVYSGKFNGVSGELVISIEGNKPVITYRNSQGGDDILNNNCHSFFGNLKQVSLSGKQGSYQLSSAQFDFSPTACSLMIQGRTMDIDFKETSKGVTLNLTLLRDLQTRQVCHWTPGNLPNIPPQQVCEWQQNPTYIYGTFSR